MRRIFFLLMVVASQCHLVSAATPKTSARQLIERMAKIQQKGIMYGHQDDPFYGITWEWEWGRSDTHDLVGDFPAVMGFDLGGIEVGDDKDLDSVPFSRIREAIQAQHRRGGIITLSWHPRNPMLGTTAWIGNDTTAYNDAVANLRKIGQCDLACRVVNPKHTVRSILPGGSHHAKFELWLHRVAEFIGSLKDDKGQPIPVIFRPWHENEGNWFWWGKANCSRDEFIALWNMTQDFLRQRFPDSIVWAFSPGMCSGWTEQAWLRYYPGDDRVDLIGGDAYQWGTEEDFRNGLTNDIHIVAKIAQDHGKLFALTECGYVNSPDATWWTRVLRPIVAQVPTCYILPWRNYKKEHFGIAPGLATADDAKTWKQNKTFLFVKDIQKIK